MKTENTRKLNATKQASYYNKAVIIERNNEIILKSYNTEVLKIDKNKNLVKSWNGYSKTTLNHINDFLKLFGYSEINKKMWLKMPCENSDTVYKIECSNGFATWKSQAILSENEAEKEIEKIQEKNSRVCAYMIEAC